MFANKQDLPGAMTVEDITDVSDFVSIPLSLASHYGSWVSVSVISCTYLYLL